MENNEYRSLSREDKIHNLTLTKQNLEKKVKNLQEQIAGIDRKLSKLQGPASNN